MTGTDTRGRRSPELVFALVLLAAGGALSAFALGRVWAAGVLAVSGYPRIEVELSGTEVLPLARAAAFVALAGVVGVLATRGPGRLVVGVVVTVAGAVATLTPPVFWVAGDLRVENRLAARFPDPTLSVGPGEIEHSHAWPALAMVGALLVLGTGLLTMVRGRSWPAMGARYDPPARAERGSTAGDGAWAQLDRGEDPTR